MSDLDLCYLRATEALALFRARKLSPVELMQAVIKRAETVNKKVNAFTFTHFDEALAAARKAEAKYAKGGRGRRARRPAGRDQGRELDQGQADLLRLADLQGLRARRHLAQQRAHPEGGRHRACAHRDAGILLLLRHPHPALGRHAQSVEPEIHPRRLVRRLGARASRPAPRRSRPARTSAGRSAFPRPAPASSATSRRTAATPTIRRSTSTPIATPARWRAPSPTRSCCRT